jgi:multidrug resistance efflux pump
MVAKKELDRLEKENRILRAKVESSKNERNKAIEEMEKYKKLL